MGRSIAARVLAPLLFSVTWACGGAAPEPQSPATPPPAPVARVAPSSNGAAADTVRASTVRFDDLGVGFTVPAGYRVLGDDELASRVRANADLRLNRSLRDRAKQKKFLPLLTLEKQAASSSDFVNVSLGVVLVPNDATAAEVLTQQQALMKDHLAAFEVLEPAKPRSVSGVTGAELVSRSTMNRSGEQRRVASVVRVYVKNGLATVITSVWPDGSAPQAEEARLVLDGLSFYDPVASPNPTP